MERIQIIEIAHILSPPHLSDVAVMSSCEKVTGIFRKERMFFSLFSSIQQILPLTYIMDLYSYFLTFGEDKVDLSVYLQNFSTN